MGCDLLKIHFQTTTISNHSFQFQIPKTQHHHQSHFSSFLPKPKSKFIRKTKLQVGFVKCSSMSSPTTPPTSKAEAIVQAKTSLSTALQKPLNNPKLSLTGKLKKLKQPRFRVEIPVIDDSPASLTQLAFEVFSDIPISRKGSPAKMMITLLWPNQSLAQAATDFNFSQLPNTVQHMDISSLAKASDTMLNSTDVAVFLAPEGSQLAAVKRVADILHPKPVVIFNPGWGFEEESSFGGLLSGFVASFEVVYAFMGLEVRGILNKRKGVIFKCALSGEKWAVLVEEGEEMKVASTFKARPSIGEVELVLYNLMAINSPITKSAKFLKDLVSNVTGKK